VRMTLVSMFVPTSPDRTPDWSHPHWNNIHITVMYSTSVLSVSF